MTTLSHVNNPQKALGPVNNAMCSALTHVFLASHYSRQGKKVTDVWERLIRLIQGVPTAGPVRPMVDAIFASDRGYNSKVTVDYIKERVGATGIGTHKRSLDYPFAFGDGPIRKKHKVRVVSQRGCRAIYSARRKPGTIAGRIVEAIVYRESLGSRIAALYHNNDRLFSANRFTLIPKPGSETTKGAVEREIFHFVFDDSVSKATESRNCEYDVTDSSARLKVRQVLSNVDEVTLLQSEDPGWFLGRAFQFTSKTSKAFIRALCEDYENNVEALSFLVCGKEVDYSHVSFPISDTETKDCLVSKLILLCHSLNIETKTAPTSEQQEQAISTVLSASVETLQNRTKNDILSLLSSVGHRQSQALRKSQLIEKVMLLKLEVQAGTTQPNSTVSHTLSPLQRKEAKMQKLLEALYRVSLTSWIMKPLVSTPGMREGSFNESQVLKALPSFFACNDVSNGNELEMSEGSHEEVKYKIEYIRTTGLISSRRDPMVSDSPDAVLCFTENDGEQHVCAVEIKTMTSLNTVDASKQRKHDHSSDSHLMNVGRNEASTKLFHELVPSTEYRIQCLHHAVSLSLKQVMFVQAKGSNLGVGGVIYATIVHLHHTLTTIYSYLLAALRVGVFPWIGKDASKIPSMYDDLLQTSHASDLNSYASYYSLNQAYRSLARRNSTLPPAQMILPTAFVYWNYLKGVVDEFSRAMTTMCYTNVGESPIVSIIGRLLCAQVQNGAVVHRLFLARHKPVLPPQYDANSSKGYREMRKMFSKCASFPDYVRQLAKEYVEVREAESRFLSCSSNNGRVASQSGVRFIPFIVEPLYSRNILVMYNRLHDKQRRLENKELHLKVNGKQAYCSLCSYSCTITKNGKKLRKRGGALQKQWCSLCRQALCTKCWDKWHTEEVLERAKIPADELQKLQSQEV